MNEISKLPTLYTERLILRPLSVLDADDMFEYARTPYVGPLAGWEPHNSVSETIIVIRNLITPRTQHDIGVWAIVDKQTGKMIGTIELYNHSPLFKAELGYSLNPKYWGLGIVPEATNEIVSYGFEFLSLKRIEVGIFVDNIQSKRVCEKTGFSFEGVSRNGYIRYDGRIFDKANYGMTREDYYNRKKVGLWYE